MNPPAKTNLAQAIPVQEICEELGKLGIAPRTIRALKSHDDFSNIGFRREQVRFLNDYFQTIVGKPITVSELALALKMNPRTVRRDLLEELVSYWKRKFDLSDFDAIS
jgi:DNA-binding CsgD family transcriptional regulator